jgi:nucleoside-diphosphate-sugar epimerase
MQGAIANGAKFIVGDNLYSYGDPNGQPITEAMPHNPHTRKGHVRAKMAEAVMAAHRSGRVWAAIGRASNYIGPEYELLGDLVFYPALKGKTANLLGKLDAPHSFTYIPDFGKTLATLGTHEEALGQIWIAPSPPAVTQRELMDLLGQEIGLPVKVRAAGTTVLRLIGLFNPALRETVEMLYEWEKPFVVDSGKFERAFGINPTSLEQAIHETVNWFRTRTMHHKRVT